MKHKYGFTLLELAIVLVTLALLVGGILMWQDMEEPPGPAPQTAQGG